MNTDIEIQENKIIGWKENYLTSNGKDNYRFEKAYENVLDFGKLNKWKLIFHILFERGFLGKLDNTIQYGLIHADSYRGSNSADIILFRATKGYHTIWNKKKE